MITIKIRNGQDPNKVFQKLKNILINEGLFEELKKRKYFVKASYKAISNAAFDPTSS